MENFAEDLVVVLQYLLPGFLAAWIFYGLTSYPKPSQFERVVQALIFTFVIQSLVSIVTYITDFWQVTQIIMGLPIIGALLIGIIFSYFANNDKLHKLCRNWGITRETSFPSEWFGTFLKDITFVVLHFQDERRLYGWPLEWPSEPTKGHFVITDPSWILDDGKEMRILGVKNILIDVKNVKWVEFLEKTWEEHEKKC